MAPLWAYAALVVAVLAMSSGGLWFALMPESPPLMKACWRLLLTALMQAPGAALQGRSLPAGFWPRYRAALPQLLLIGLSLGTHFGAWGWSVAHTSLAHSLLLVWSTPLLMVALMAARAALHGQGLWVALEEPAEEPAGAGAGAGAGAAAAAAAPAAPKGAPPLPPTLREGAGAVAGFAGVALLLAGAESPQGGEVAVSLAGDAAAVLGAAAIIPYLEGGAALRAWMPLFVYALPVTLSAAGWLCLASLALEGGLGTTLAGTGPASLLGFLGSPRRAGLSLGAALVSGILGHTLANLALKHLSPLLIGVSCLWEPVLGSILGYLVGVQGQPSAMTAVAAPLILLGGALVTLGARPAGAAAAPAAEPAAAAEAGGAGADR